VLFDSDKLRKLVATACGYCDGFLSRLGTFETRHPHLAAFCGRSLRTTEKVERTAAAAMTGVEP
jgi:hypothetical protein